MDLTSFFTEAHLEIIFKLILSAVLATFIGIDRQLTNKLAGIKTQILVCLGSTIFTYLSIHSFENIATESGILFSQPSRVAAQILTGVGFIGGGVILKTKGNVYGVTTAASLWTVASIGMAVGTGDFFIAILGTLIATLVLVFIRKIERKYLDKLTKKPSKVKIDIRVPTDKFAQTYNYVTEKFTNLSEVKFSSSTKESNLSDMQFLIEIPQNKKVNEVYKLLTTIEDIEYLNVYQDMAPFD
ncbi:MAG: MgtC/SapB family protein [Vampirovibrionia bacterium]